MTISDGFRQCVDRETGAAATEPMLDLSESCRLLGDEPSSLLRRPDDETCSDEDPGQCDKVGTLCCNGRCWGLPVETQDDACDGGVGDCPAGKL